MKVMAWVTAVEPMVSNESSIWFKFKQFPHFVSCGLRGLALQEHVTSKKEFNGNAHVLSVEPTVEGHNNTCIIHTRLHSVVRSIFSPTKHRQNVLDESLASLHYIKQSGNSICLCC